MGYCGLCQQTKTRKYVYQTRSGRSRRSIEQGDKKIIGRPDGGYTWGDKKKSTISICYNVKLVMLYTYWRFRKPMVRFLLQSVSPYQALVLCVDTKCVIRFFIYYNTD